MQPLILDDQALRVESVTDADYGGDCEYLKSVSGIMTKINGMLIGWNT